MLRHFFYEQVRYMFICTSFNFSASSKRQDRAGARVEGATGNTGRSDVTQERDDVTKTQIATVDRRAAEAEQGVPQGKGVYGFYQWFYSSDYGIFVLESLGE